MIASLRFSGLLLAGILLSQVSQAEQDNRRCPRGNLAPDSVLELPYGDGSREVGLFPGREDAPPVGPDYLAAGPDGLVAFYDRVKRRVVVVRPGRVVSHFPVRRLDGLSVTSAGNVIVFNRMANRLTVFDRGGNRLRSRKLNRRPPDGGRLRFEDGAVYSMYPDGQRKLGSVSENEIGDSTAEALVAPPVRIRRNPARRNELQLGDETVSNPDALRLGGRWIGGNPRWFEIEEVRQDSASGEIQVCRYAKQGTRQISLPASGRAYRPAVDVDVSPENTLVFLAPGRRGVRVIWVRSP